MKKYLLIMYAALITVNFSCNNSNDLFVGEWVYFDQPNIPVVIPRNGDEYKIHHVFYNTFPSFRFP